MTLVEAREAQTRLRRMIDGAQPSPDLPTQLQQIDDALTWALDLIEYPDEPGENNAPDHIEEEDTETVDK